MIDSAATVMIPVDSVRFVKELYPRLREDDAAIQRYRAALDRLPPIVTARDGLLVDGFHRWQAHRREGVGEIAAVDLGNLTDAEIVRESIQRNATHGQQLSADDKKRLAAQLWRQLVHLKHGERLAEIMALLAVSDKSAERWTKSARADELAEQKARAYDAWLDCLSYREIGVRLDVTDKTIAAWCAELAPLVGNSAPASRQHFDVWSFATADGESSYFGRMPEQVVENLLWSFTEPGQIVVDPFAGGGTTIDVAKRMGRRVWASDLTPSTPMLPIHAHDITSGWPSAAPARADLILLDPPYWQQAAGRYSDDPRDLGNQTLDDFMASWRTVVAVCLPHLAAGGRLAFIVSPTQDGERVVDHAVEMWLVCRDQGLVSERRVIVPYQTQQATGQQVTWARDGRRLLKLYRDLVVMRLL